MYQQAQISSHAYQQPSYPTTTAHSSQYNNAATYGNNYANKPGNTVSNHSQQPGHSTNGYTQHNNSSHLAGTAPPHNVQRRGAPAEIQARYGEKRSNILNFLYKCVEKIQSADAATIPQKEYRFQHDTLLPSIQSQIQRISASTDPRQWLTESFLKLFDYLKKSYKSVAAAQQHQNATHSHSNNTNSVPALTPEQLALPVNVSKPLNTAPKHTLNAPSQQQQPVKRQRIDDNTISQAPTGSTAQPVSASKPAGPTQLQQYIQQTKQTTLNNAISYSLSVLQSTTPDRIKSAQRVLHNVHAAYSDYTGPLLPDVPAHNNQQTPAAQPLMIPNNNVQASNQQPTRSPPSQQYASTTDDRAPPQPSQHYGNSMPQMQQSYPPQISVR